MPTGYTADFETKDVSFTDFVWHCARGFGAFSHMRDDFNQPLNYPNINCDHYDNEISKYQKELLYFDQISDDDLRASLVSETEKNIKFFAERVAEKVKLSLKYNDMLDKVNNWNPPTSNHIGLKSFMIEQLKTSIDFDCNIKFDLSQIEDLKLKSSIDLDIYRKNKINEIKLRMQRCMDYRKSDLERNRNNCQWISELNNSVPNPNLK